MILTEIENNVIDIKNLNNIDDEEVIYSAAVFGLREYVYDNEFKSVIIGLSGGIDSAITSAIAADALGAENVLAVMMSTKFTSKKSKEDARELVKTLGIKSKELQISNAFNTICHVCV